MKTPTAVMQLVSAADQDPHLQARLACATDAQQVVAIAGAIGITVTVAELRVVSRDLSAPYWPWAGRGNALRRTFFQRGCSSVETEPQG